MLEKYELDKRILCFTENAPKYSGNPEKVFEWCEKLKNHLFNHKWERIPSEAVKRMLLACITDSDRQEIVLLQFFTELLKKFSEEKDKEGRKQDYLARKQGRNEDSRKFYTFN